MLLAAQTQQEHSVWPRHIKWGHLQQQGGRTSSGGLCERTEKDGNTGETFHQILLSDTFLPLSSYRSGSILLHLIGFIAWILQGTRVQLICSQMWLKVSGVQPFFPQLHNWLFGSLWISCVLSHLNVSDEINNIVNSKKRVTWVNTRDSFPIMPLRPILIFSTPQNLTFATSICGTKSNI